jgi:hypothetical protein
MEVSSGNIFADLSLPDAVELDTTVCLAMAIDRLLQSRRLTSPRPHGRSAAINPKVSALKHYKLDGFSVERLMSVSRPSAATSRSVFVLRGDCPLA